MTSFVKYTLLCLALVLGTAAKGDASATQVECEMLILLLPEGLQNFPMASCEHLENAQVTISTTVIVPAHRVVEVERVLTASYGMEPLQFVCCGYDTKLIVFPLPKSHPLAEGTPNGAFRSVMLSFFAVASSQDDIGKTVHGLGAFDATITIEMVDY
ncbi:hypothetical protein [Sulfitobacter sp.]|uniref:hypothetical protein n=1 Tax=Sulfitobacter sp. TaxID=1903071 RepID=UPI0039E52651